MTKYHSKDLTPGEVAAELRVSLTTVYKYLRNGTLRSYRLGRASGDYRIPREALDAFKWTPGKEDA